MMFEPPPYHLTSDMMDVGSVPLIRLDIRGNTNRYIMEALNEGQLTYRGRFNAEFEHHLTRYLGRPALACSSGTGALHLALLAAGVQSGDEVIVPDLTFGTAASVVCAVGAKPVLADVDPGTFCLSEGTVQKALTHKTKAIIKTHLYGLECCLPDYGVTVIEDSCEAFGIVPPTGDYTCYSFYVNKIITTGEGGCVATDDVDMVRDYRDGGFAKDSAFRVPGLNYRMTALQAALGVAQMERVDELVKMRLDTASRYEKRLKGRGKWLFNVETSDPVGLMAYLASKHIESRRVFKPLHLHPAFSAKGCFDGADEIWSRHVSLPTQVTMEQQDYIVDMLNGTGNVFRPDNGGCELAAPF